MQHIIIDVPILSLCVALSLPSHPSFLLLTGWLQEAGDSDAGDKGSVGHAHTEHWFCQGRLCSTLLTAGMYMYIGVML